MPAGQSGCRISQQPCTNWGHSDEWCLNPQLYKTTSLLPAAGRANTPAPSSLSQRARKARASAAANEHTHSRPPIFKNTLAHWVPATGASWATPFQGEEPRSTLLWPNWFSPAAPGILPPQRLSDTKDAAQPPEEEAARSQATKRTARFWQTVGLTTLI